MATKYVHASSPSEPHSLSLPSLSPEHRPASCNPPLSPFCLLQILPYHILSWHSFLLYQITSSFCSPYHHNCFLLFPPSLSTILSPTHPHRTRSHQLLHFLPPNPFYAHLIITILSPHHQYHLHFLWESLQHHLRLPAVVREVEEGEGGAGRGREMEGGGRGNGGMSTR